MRKEPFTVDNYVHVYNRGNRKQPIVYRQEDKWHFLQMLYYFNSELTVANPFQELKNKLGSQFNKKLIWPNEWPTQKPIVKIIAFSLMKNHFHLLLKEIREGGISLFMQKLGTGMTSYFNNKYQETGRLFGGSYKAKVVDKDEYLKYLSVYIHVKNPLEVYPQGFEKAMKNFDEAFEWAIKYPYCSLADYVNGRNSPIINKDILEELFESPEEHKNFIKGCMFSINLNEKLESLAIDS